MRNQIKAAKDCYMHKETPMSSAHNRFPRFTFLSQPQVICPQIFMMPSPASPHSASLDMWDSRGEVQRREVPSRLNGS